MSNENTEETIEIRATVDLTITRTYEADEVVMEVRKDLLTRKGKLTREAVMDWIQAAGHDSLGSYYEEVEDLSFSVKE